MIVCFRKDAYGAGPHTPSRMSQCVESKIARDQVAIQRDRVLTNRTSSITGVRSELRVRGQVPQQHIAAPVSGSGNDQPAHRLGDFEGSLDIVLNDHLLCEVQRLIGVLVVDCLFLWS